MNRRFNAEVDDSGSQTRSVWQRAMSGERLSLDTLLGFGQMSIVVRWVFVFGAVVALLIARRFGWLQDSFVPVARLVVVFGVYNGLTQLFLAQIRRRAELPVRVLVVLKRFTVAVDVAMVAAFVHFTGGVLSPLMPMWFVQFVVIALVTTAYERMALYLFSLLAIGLVIYGEYQGWWTHHQLVDMTMAWRDPRYVLAVLAFWVALLLIAQMLVRRVRLELADREAQLFRSSRRLRRLRAFQDEVLEHLPAGVVVFGGGGQIRSANAVARQLLGIDGDPHRNLLRLQRVEATGLDAWLQKVLAGETVELEEFPFTDEAGRRRWLRLHIEPPGRGREGVLVIDDLSPLKEREARERRLQQRLAQADKFTSLGQMASGVAHELNNPLTAIVSTAQFLQYASRQHRLTPDVVEEKCEHILLHGRRIEHLVRGLAAYGKPDTGRHAPISVRAALEELLSFSAFEFRRARIRLEADIEDVPPFLANRVDLQQAVLNLLTNARQAIELAGQRDGLIRLQVIRETVDDQDVLVIRVSDNGPGIPPDVRDRIFEPFFTTKSEDEGTGLGLAIVHALVQRYEGSIVVDSTPGEGTVFELRLPYLEELADWVPTGDQTFSPYR